MTSNMLLLSFVFVLMIVALWRLRGYAFAWGATADDVRRSWPGDELCPAHFIMERRMLRQIKDLAERHSDRGNRTREGPRVTSN